MASHGRPDYHEGVPAALKRALTQDDLVCEAAEVLGGDAVYCAIEENVIDAHLDPTSIERFCAGCYTECPTWRTEKERIWARKREIADVLPVGA